MIKKGKVYQEVVGQAQAFPDSIIIGSTHGASGFEELFIGSNAFRIVSATTKPVITLRKGPIPEKISKIVMPIDVSTESRQKVMFTALFASVVGAEVHVLAVSGSKSKKVVSRLNAYVAQVCNYLKTKEIQFYSVNLCGGSPVTETLAYAEKIGADLIAISNEGSDSFTELLMGSDAQQMISTSSLPVLTIRAKSHTIKGSFSTFAG
jgi:nucleotide-binding universal stress UspA family protein